MGIAFHQAGYGFAIPSQGQAIIYRLTRQGVNGLTQGSDATEAVAGSCEAHQHLVAFWGHLSQLRFSFDKNVKSDGWITLVEEKGIALDLAEAGSLEHDLQSARLQALKRLGLSKKLSEDDGVHRANSVSHPLSQRPLALP
jgi:hypothetical protein